MGKPLLERVTGAARIDPSALLPLHSHGRQIGWLQPSFADVLMRYPAAFARDALGVRVASIAHMEKAVLALAAEGWITGWRDEPYDVRCGAKTLFTLERAAFRRFGMLAAASHLNGWVAWEGGFKLWIARRSASKPIDPGMLDNLVGGGIAAGSSPAATLAKECGEEAGIDTALAHCAAAAGCLRITRMVENGVHDEIVHVFDLELPSRFVPSNRDGEVAEFMLLEPAEVARRVAAGEFTIDAGAIIVDFLLRRGWLDDPEVRDAIKVLREDPR